MQEHNTTHVMRRMTQLLPKATLCFVKDNCLPKMDIDPSQTVLAASLAAGSMPLRLF
jgi:hypothetical protein